LLGCKHIGRWVELYLNIPLLIINDKLLLSAHACHEFRIAWGVPFFIILVVQRLDSFGILIGDNMVLLSLNAICTTGANVLIVSKIVYHSNNERILM
jgi:hypothetical protein